MCVCMLLHNFSVCVCIGKGIRSLFAVINSHPVTRKTDGKMQIAADVIPCALWPGTWVHCLTEEMIY